MGPEHQIASAVAAVEIRSRVRFRWLGVLSDPPPVPIPSAGERARRTFLVSALAHRLYRDFFASGGVRASPPENDVLQDPGFVAQLREANAGAGRWEPNWLVAGVGEDRVTVTRDGLTLRAPISACRPAHGLRLADPVMVRFPKDAPGRWPGYYLALGDRSIPLGARVVRIYWHVEPGGAPNLVRSITERLNAADVPFELKVLDRPAAYDRFDTAVLYLARPDASAGRVLRTVARDVRTHMRNGIPAMTKRLLAGIAAAHDPGDGVSFGFHRCSLLAEGIVRAHDMRRRTLDGRMAAVGEVFAERGFDLRRPYRSSGSGIVR